MGRVAGRVIALLVAMLLVGSGCSAGKESTGGPGASTASTTAGPSGSTTADPAATVADPGDPGLPGAPSAPVGDGSADATTVPGSPPVSSPGATATGGWRLVVTQPVAGATVGRATVLCYEVSGPTPQSDVALEIAVGGGAPVKAAGAVGRGSTPVDLTPDPEPQDLRVQLLVDGQRLDGAAVSIPAVLVVPAALEPDCA